MLPRTSDVIISNRSARVEHDVNVLSQGLCLTCPNRETAEAKGHELAKAYQVDLWLTEDRTHFILVASYRADSSEGQRTAVAV